jgi:hypothetical protein
MLTPDRVLNFIKSNLGFPFQQLELTDEQIIDYIKDYSLREFCLYSPDKNSMGINLTVEAYKVPGRSNEFYLYEPDGLEILNVTDVIPQISNYLITGHPFMGAFNLGDLREFALNTEVGMMIHQFSNFSITFEFKHPNKLRVSPNPSDFMDQMTIEYERMHSETFETIPYDIEVLFCNFCLADIMIMLGRIRKKYGDGNLRTPFGDIPLSAEIFDEGTTKKNEIIEKLENRSWPNVIFNRG